MVNQFDILRNKEIIQILDGDRIFGYYYDVQVSMPYLSGNNICSILLTFGYEEKYIQGCYHISRWNMFDILLNHCIASNNIQDLLKYLFQKERFQKQFNELPTNEIQKCYSYIVQTVIENINRILYLNNKELIHYNGNFYIKGINKDARIETPTIGAIDRGYIRGLCERASKDIDDGNFDSAITKCRTLIEEVFCYAVEQAGKEPTDSGDIQKLYNQVKASYCMHTNKNLDLRINTLLSGLNKIISSIAEMRNENSDSHGVGNRRITIEEYHARLILNATSTIAEFFLAVVNKKQRTLKTL